MDAVFCGWLRHVNICAHVGSISLTSVLVCIVFWFFWLEPGGLCALGSFTYLELMCFWPPVLYCEIVVLNACDKSFWFTWLQARGCCMLSSYFKFLKLIFWPLVLMLFGCDIKCMRQVSLDGTMCFAIFCSIFLERGIRCAGSAPSWSRGAPVTLPDKNHEISSYYWWNSAQLQRSYHVWKEQNLRTQSVQGKQRFFCGGLSFH